MKTLKQKITDILLDSNDKYMSASYTADKIIEAINKHNKPENHEQERFDT